MKVAVVGPTYPFRGGIAHHTTLMVRHLRQRHTVGFYSFKSQYPRWLFPGRTDRDPSTIPLREPCEYLLSPLDPISWMRTAARIRAFRPNLLILPWWVPFWAPAWSVLTRLARRGRSLPVLVICHNVLPHERSLWDRPLARLALSAGTHFVVHSQQDAGQLLALYPEASVRVTPLPTYESVGQAVLDPATARQRLGLEITQPVLLFFGFVRPYKGLDILLDALPTVRREVAVHLLVVGEIWDNEANYQAQIDRLGLAAHVTLVNRYVPNEELGLYFGAADVVVLPYRSATQSAIVQLAFGLGKPVITTQVGGLVEAVVDDVCGLTVPAGNPSALADAIIRFYHESLGPSLAAGVSALADRYSWDGLVEIAEQVCRLSTEASG